MSECKICYTNINGVITTTLCDCKENYHHKCLNDWIEKNNNCPKCNKKFETENEKQPLILIKENDKDLGCCVILGMTPGCQII
jgi:hypothetical protein